MLFPNPMTNCQNRVTFRHHIYVQFGLWITNFTEQNSYPLVQQSLGYHMSKK